MTQRRRQGPGRWRGGIAGLAVLAGAAGLLAVATRLAIEPPPARLVTAGDARPQYRDRHGEVLTVTYANRWNLHEQVALHAMPPLLVEAFVLSEDRRFFAHDGVDWLARGHALWQNLRAGGVVRGASTLTEQSVRLLHPRPRTPWSRWLEGFEAGRLEARFSKGEILEFYLNQVPYGARRRGVVQAARYYFDRDLDSLTHKEMLALVVLVRAPGAYDPYRYPGRLEAPLQRLAERVHEAGLLDATAYARLKDTPLAFESSPPLQVVAPEFVQFLAQGDGPRDSRVRTTLDARIQRAAQGILSARLRDLSDHNVTHAAALVVDHQNGDILAWANVRADVQGEAPRLGIDAVVTPRQPGSTLKPFVYALALERGWTAATLIDDAPVSAWVGHGSHRYRNYSNTYYGPLRLRDALGNSLNIPAVRTAQYVGVDQLLARLHALGIESLRAHPDYYGDGLALGNGEITLFELVGAYATLAHGGQRQPLTGVVEFGGGRPVAAIDPQAASLVANILADPDARRLEFGSGSLLRFPVETAVKTGTSSDYRDAWTVGFNHRYTVGVWMGNLDYAPMRDVTGATGPALAVRALFAELNRFEETRPLWLSPRLHSEAICREDGRRADDACARRAEWFMAGTAPAEQARPVRIAPVVRLAEPTPGLMLAMDPRIPDAHEAFAFRLVDGVSPARTEWLVDGEVRAVTGAGVTRWLWPVSRGEHRASARVWIAEENQPVSTPEADFLVK